MQTVDVALGERSYPIHVGPGLLSEAGTLLASCLPRKRAMVVSNPVVSAHWLDPLRRSLAAAGIDAQVLLIPDGEANKTLATIADLVTRFLEHGSDRTTGVIALGGGVVGDMAGFAAAIYQRGV